MVSRKAKMLFACAVAGGEPLFERVLAFVGGLAGEDVLDADVFVQVGPVNALAIGDKPPVLALLAQIVVGQA